MIWSPHPLTRSFSLGPLVFQLGGQEREGGRAVCGSGWSEQECPLLLPPALPPLIAHGGSVAGVLEEGVGGPNPPLPSTNKKRVGGLAEPAGLEASQLVLSFSSLLPSSPPLRWPFQATSWLGWPCSWHTGSEKLGTGMPQTGSNFTVLQPLIPAPQL